jgi:hypothetical protein
MLLNTWLSAARRHFTQKSGTRRVARSVSRGSVRTESLEARSLLTALVINPDTKGGYLNAVGGIEVDNADMVGKDGLIIEGFTISPTSGDAISINLSGITLKNLAIESIIVTQYTTLGFDIDLNNVSGLHTVAIEDVSIRGTARALDLTLSNTSVDALTIDDSTIPGIKVSSLNGASIAQALITESTVIAGPGVEGILLSVDSATADNFRIEDNLRISSPNRDFVRIDSTDSPLEGLSIIDNQIGTVTQGSGLLFRADGDTFVQPLLLTNSSTKGELIQTFRLDLTAIGLQFDDNAISGKPFTPVGTTGTSTGFQSAVLSADKKILTVTFLTASGGETFAPGETLQFNIDIDLAGGTPASVFGNNLIGADITATFSGNFIVAGQMIGDPAKSTASEFAVGPRTTGTTQGILLNLVNSPTTNLFVTGNTVAGTPGHAFQIKASAFSDVTGTIQENKFLGSGRDGINLAMVDSNFTGAIIGNNVANNAGSGISINPSVSRSGLVEAVLDSNPVVVTSTNHGLTTGDQIILQGLVNDDPTVNHPANGLHTITRIDNNRFRVNLVSGLAPGVRYVGGGAWYVPDFRTDGSARGLVTIDMQATVPRGTIRAATNAGPIVITSPNHGLKSGQSVRISNVAGNTAANGVQRITVLDGDRFRLDGTTGNGAYDTTGGFGTWQANVVTAAANSSNLILTSPGHGLKTGEEIRVTGVLGNTAANGTFKVSVLTANTFRLIGAVGNGTYGGGGSWVQLKEKTSTGDFLAQNISKNLVTGNLQTGIRVDLATGTVFDGDIVGNTVSQNLLKGIHILSHSFGLGTDLPLDPNDPLALPGLQDISFDVNIGTSSKGDENILDGNTQAGVVIEALDFGTGSFRIQNNRITSSRNDNLNSTPYQGDGIVVRLTDDVLPSEAVSFLSESLIDGNIIGVDDQGNQGHGVFFDIEQRTRIQDLKVTNNNFLNNGIDGFHFERSEDADLNSVVAEKNRATNNLGDGFEFYAINTTEDRLDFKVNENIISDNSNYGVRFNVIADARIEVEFDRNQVTSNGISTGAAENGFHPDDAVPGFAGNSRAEGGVGILGFQQADVIFSAEDSKIDNNVGDGFSADAFNFFDTLILNATFTNTTFNGNTLTGVRNHGAAFGSFDIRNSEFNLNGEDGFRSISNVDKTDFFERRVGGMIIHLTSLNSQYTQNGQSGMQLGQGVSAVLGDGTINEANIFDQNGEDGLKVTQSAGPFLAGQNTYDYVTQLLTPDEFQYISRRHVEASTNFFRNNKGDGIDIGHFAATEGGNVEHGDEVITDVHVTVNNAEISGNEGDGIEYLADSTLRITPVVGGGQDVEYGHRSSLSLTDSRVVGNDKRGIDILNRRGEDSTVSLINNEILSNGSEGIYVLNTASNQQLQGSSSDPLDPYLETFVGSSDDSARHFSVGTKIRQIHFEVSPNIELRVQDNLIESNGSVSQTSTVPINLSDNANNANGVANPHWTHQFRQIQGTLGGLVVRVGAVDSAGQIELADPDVELGLSGIDAEVYRNSFDGNIGADVYFDNFTSQIPAQSIGNFDTADDPDYRWDLGYRDPLARLDLVFRENAGNSLDVINGFAFLDNHETEFKSRANRSDAPNHGHDPLSPRGPFGNGYDRFRNQTRTIGYFNIPGEVPDGQPVNLVGLPFWSYDGWGTPTWRVESDFDFNNFTTTDPTLGFSDFYDVTNLGISLGEEQYQWDTGNDVPGFNGVTPYSLTRGDIFNVGPGQAPIAADSLEDNDSFLGAFDLGTVAGPGYSVNSRATNNTLSIEKKGDRDYYRFTAAGSGALDLNLNATDAQGDTLYFMLYEVVPGLKSQEVPVLKNANGTPQFVVVARGTSDTISTTVVAGREYIIEVLGNEAANVGPAFFANSSKPFVYGTARTYGLSIDAPAAAPGGSSGSGSGNAGAGAASGGNGNGAATTTETGGAGTGASGGSIPGARPTAAFATVSPDPRSVSAGFVTLNFTEDVTGVDIADFRLTKDGVNIPLTASMLTQVSAMQYTLNLTTNTGNSGTYALTLRASGSGIRDTDNLALLANATDSWVTSNLVNTTADTPDSSVGDKLARDINGRMSLRAAVMESNDIKVGLDVIRLGSATYFLSQIGRFEDDALTGDLDVKGNLIIRGVSAAATVIHALDLDRIFHVFAGATLTLENLTIRGGEAFDGGAIFNEGTVILRNVNISGNEAFNQGGGIFNAPRSVLNATGSAIINNVAGSRGGGINNLGTATFLNTTFSTNTAISRGGALFNEGAARSSLINVTVSNNFAASRGAGLASETARTSTLGNTILESNITIARVPAFDSTINRDLMGVVTSLGNNFIQVLDRRFTTATSAGLLTSDRFGRDATPLQKLTSGLTQSQGNGVGIQPLIAGRAAIDGGSNTVYPSTNLLSQKDAVGNPRLIEGNGDGLITIDAGAAEFLVTDPVAIFTTTPNPAGFDDTITFDGRGSTHPNPAVGSIVLWEWDFDFNGSAFVTRATGSRVTRKYPVGKTEYIVALRVTDNFGNTDIELKTLRFDAPMSPVIVRPGTVTTDLTPTFRWTGDPGTYDLELFRINGTTEVPVFPLVTLTSQTFTPTSPLALGNYKLRITARNSNFTSPSVSHVFKVGTMYNLAPSGSIFDVTPKFSWGAVPGSSRYELKVRRVMPTVVENVISEAFIADTFYETPSSLGLGQFEWQVRAYDVDGVAGEWGPIRRITTAQIAFTKPAPSTVDTTPTFTWTNMDGGQGTTKYEFWLNQVGGQAKYIVEPALTSTTYTPTTPLPNGTYDAWVRPLAADGEAGLWSPVRRFVMDYRVGPVTYSPIGVTTDVTPTFRWQAADGASSYDLWVDNLTTGVQQVIRVTVPHRANVAEITYTPTSSLTAGDYRWWVQTVAASGVRTSFSAGVDFTVPVPTIINPRGTIATNLPRFTWNGVAEYVSYELWVDNVTTGAKEVLRVSGITNKFYQTTLPLENGDFKVWVRGYDKDGNVSQWSGPANFTVTVGVGNAPILSGSFTNGSGLRTFLWSAGTGASTYEIIVKRISDPGQPVVLNETGISGTTFTAPTAFTAGTYRWWIRGLDADGNGLPWSQPLLFFVQSTNETVPADASEVALAAMATPVVFDTSVGFWSDDIVRSITATPAGSVIQINPKAIQPEPVVELPVAVAEDVVGIDDVMEEWASMMMEDSVSQDIPVSKMLVSSPTSSENTQSDGDNRSLDLLMAGMALGAVVSKSRKSKDQQ